MQFSKKMYHIIHNNPKQIKENPVSLATKREEVLKVLEDNIHTNLNPGVVCSDFIAKKINVSLPELIEVLKVMNEMGVIVSNIDNEYSIITSKGLDLHRQRQCMQQVR